MNDWSTSRSHRDAPTVPVVLAHQLPFRLGVLQVEPALRLVSIDDGGDEVVQQRTMQVLVCLARSEGRILTREDLIASCWGGANVSDDAINRVISQLRRLAEGIGARSFTIETVTRVGYRLVVAPIATPPLEMADVGTAEVAVAPAGSLPEPRPQPSIASANYAAHKWAIIAVAVGAAALVAILAGLSLRPDVASSSMPQLSIATSAGPGVPAAWGQTLHDEMASAIAPEKLHIVGPAQDGVFHLSARITQVGREQLVFGELRPPGGGAAIWTPRYAVRDAGSLNGIAKQLMWASLGDIDSEAARAPVNASPVAVAAWASYCEENTKDIPDNRRQIESLRTAVRAEPRFGDAQVTLALMLGNEAPTRPGPEAEAMRAEGLRAAAAAERINPHDATVHVARFYLTPDFVRADRELRLALAAGSSDDGVEFQTLAQFLSATGRSEAALAAFRQALAIAPGNPIDINLSASLLASMGRDAEARAIFANQSATQNDNFMIDRLWLEQALAARDWSRATGLVGSAAFDERTLQAEKLLILGLAKADGVLVQQAGAQFETLAGDPVSLSPALVLGLAYSGRTASAMAAEGRLFDAKGRGVLRILYWPIFRAARRTPEFAALVERIGLANYWRGKGNLPDFCRATDAPGLCAKLRKPNT